MSVPIWVRIVRRGRTRSTHVRTVARSAWVQCGPLRRKQPTTPVSTPCKAANAASSRGPRLSSRRRVRCAGRGTGCGRGPARTGVPVRPAVSILSPAGGPSRATSTGQKIRWLPRTEGVGEAAGHLVQSGAGGEGVQRPVHLAIEDANFVDAGDVVGVRVGVDHGVDAGDPASEKLGPQVRSGVHGEASLPAFDHDAGAGAGVARLGGIAAPQSPAPSTPPISGTPAEPPVPSKVMRIPGLRPPWGTDGGNSPW